MPLAEHPFDGFWRFLFRLHRGERGVRGVPERAILDREMADCGSGVGDMSGVSALSMN